MVCERAGETVVDGGLAPYLTVAELRDIILGVCTCEMRSFMMPSIVLSYNNA